MKTQFILSLYDALLVGQKVSRQTFCMQNAVSERTFYRYINEISLFIMHNRHDLVLKVDEPVGKYYLEKS